LSPFGSRFGIFAPFGQINIQPFLLTSWTQIDYRYLGEPIERKSQTVTQTFTNIFKIDFEVFENKVGVSQAFVNRVAATLGQQVAPTDCYNNDKWKTN
jgi:hypothetical protein